MSRSLRIALLGACGRMGREVERKITGAVDLRLAYRADPSLSREGGAVPCGPDLAEIAPGSIDGIIDFSTPEGTRHAAEQAGRLGCALVSGTTGLPSECVERLRHVSQQVPVCWSPNFSLGVPLLAAALRVAARMLPADWQIEIEEIHHAGKKDAPSGTALRLAQTWRDERGGRLVHGREGMTGPRADDEIGVHSLRLAGVVGEHRILLGSGGEILEATHRMQDRSGFAGGSIEALRRLSGEGPGWYEWETLLLRG